MNAKINIEKNQLETPKYSLQIHKEFKSIIPPTKIKSNSKQLVTIPVTNKKGNFYIESSKLSQNLNIQEGIYNTCAPYKATVEIINLGQEEETIEVMTPINVTKFENFHEINFHIANKKVMQVDFEAKINTENLNNEEKQSILKLCKQFQHLFYDENQELTFTNNIKHEINLLKEKPYFVKQYRHPEHQKPEIKIEIDKLLKNKIIRLSFSPWSSPIWMVPKKPDANGNKKWRLVVDFRRLNA